MRKKLLTVALAATMAISSVFSAFAATTISGGFWKAWTPGFEIKDTLELDIDVKGGSENWNNVTAVFTNVLTDGTDPNATKDTTGYKEYAVVRADSWGWGNGDNKSLDGNDITYTSDIVDANGDSDVWDDFKAVMKDAHIDATFAKTADGIKLTYAVKGANGVSFNYTAETKVDTSAGLYVFFVCDGSEVTVSKPETKEEPTTTAATTDEKTTPAETTTPVAGSKDNGTSPKTADTAAVAVVAIVALGAAVAVVASRKKVTE